MSFSTDVDVLIGGGVADVVVALEEITVSPPPYALAINVIDNVAATSTVEVESA